MTPNIAYYILLEIIFCHKYGFEIVTSKIRLYLARINCQSFAILHRKMCRRFEQFRREPSLPLWRGGYAEHFGIEFSHQYGQRTAKHHRECAALPRFTRSHRRDSVAARPNLDVSTPLELFSVACVTVEDQSCSIARHHEHCDERERKCDPGERKNRRVRERGYGGERKEEKAGGGPKTARRTYGRTLQKETKEE